MLLDEEKIAQPEMGDVEILRASRDNPALFEVLVSRYEEAFLRKAKYILKDDEKARDVVQDAFVKIYLNAARYQPMPGASLKSWMYKVLVNLCFTVWKKGKRDQEFNALLDPELMELVRDAGEEVEREARYDRDTIVSLLSKLPVTLVRVIELHFLEGKPQREVARAVGISEGAVRARVHRAKQAMKKLLISK
ncbi:MAG: RNA polymerase, sigma-24 subunit, RpoE [Parcubacteria group bacterium GW2011_GWA2_47_12]|nr:MAG: RNA polymerase, sigma-24 subunit, RpoE [Parcubacteria group bacterium GW2011_GWA2_47_12]